TGDSGLFPHKTKQNGEPEEHDNGDPKLDLKKPLYKVYPKKFIAPDLLIAHIGSIKKQEFLDPQKYTDLTEDRWYYADHLGILGTLQIIHQVKPKAAIISEFGSELKGFHFELVEKIAQALRERQTFDEIKTIEQTLVIPGDITLLYKISDHKLYCHETNVFEDISKLLPFQGKEYVAKFDENADEYDAKAGNSLRSFLRIRLSSNESKHGKNIKDFFRKYFNCGLPIHK
ncbi:hypothetical protein K8T06_12960, partial [bacterium]|nr:hypothetical protein [bacterium]